MREPLPAKLGSFQKEQADKGTVLGKFEGIQFSLFVYEYPLIRPPLKYLSLNIADILDIAAMKIDAVATRGAKRDFIDLYFISKSGYALINSDIKPPLLVVDPERFYRSGEK
ncbi:MAG: hypothetical protein JRJ38_15700 [Deltaproteobacteria bacterium]|nr:hypothetical protein [Deltaproteobacteria bacterium]